MKKPKSKKPSKDIRINFRMTKEEYEPIKKILEETGWTLSEFIRMKIKDELDVEKIVPKEKVRITKLLYYFNKASNNINQLARMANIANQNDKLSDKKYNDFLIFLSQLNENFHYGLFLCENA